MNLQRKPRLGVLALMLEGYEPLFPGITRRQTDYVHALLEHLAPAAEFIFPGPAVNAGDMARLVGRYNAEGADGILILLLSYAQGQYLAHALRENCLPLALALVQPDESVGVDFGELELTVNQGIHGSQDCANALLRAGIPCEFYAGPRADGQLLTFVSDFAAAAATARDMRSMRIGVIGGLAFFIFGMQLMAEGLQQIAGDAGIFSNGHQGFLPRLRIFKAILGPVKK